MRLFRHTVRGVGLLVLLAGAHARAFDIEAGIGGLHRTGVWTPIVVTVPAVAVPADAAWHAWVEDPDGQWVRTPAAVETPADGVRKLRFRARFGRPSGGVCLEGPDADGRTQRTQLPLPAAQPADEKVILVIGDLESAERAARLMAREDGGRPRVVRVPRTGDLAAGAGGISARDFDGIDAIVACGNAIAGSDDAFSLEVIAAIDGWVRDGGRLVFAAGESAVRAAVPGAIAAGWLPGPPGASGRVERLVPLRRSAALESFGRAARPLDRGALATLEAPLVADAGRLDGMILAFEGRSPADLPLVVRSVHGFGTITWLGLDIDRPAFRAWTGTDTLLVELLGRRTAAADSGRGGETSRGELDLAAQLRAAIDRFPGVAPVPFELVAGLGILYVVCLYPLDWWLASRGGRPAVAWVSLPVFVLLFSGLAWGAGRRWKIDAWGESVAGIVDVDLVGGLTRGWSWAGAWAPVNARLDVAVAPTTAVAATSPDIAVSWCAAAGRGLGGTDASAPHPALGAADYAYADGLTALRGTPIAADASRVFEAHWTAPSTTGEAFRPIVASLDADAQAALRGMIESRLPFDLEDCVLTHAGWLYDVGRLSPGGRFEPGAGRGPRSLAGALTRRAAAKERDVAERWDASGTDVRRILEVAGFHQAAGGRGYTSLEPGRLARLDLSPVLDTGRAVLVGRGPAGTDWRIRADAGHDSPSIPPAVAQTAIWRFVLPLKGSKP